MRRAKHRPDRLFLVRSGRCPRGFADRGHDRPHLPDRVMTDPTYPSGPTCHYDSEDLTGSCCTSL